MTDNTLGVHAFAFTSQWQVPQMREVLPPIVERGVGLIEVPLLRPTELDADGSRKLAASLDIELVCSLGLPAHFDILTGRREIGRFLEEALEVTARTGAAALSGVTYGTIGKTSGAPPTRRELDAVARIVESGARAAAARGLRFGIEPCNRYETHLINRAIDARRVIEQVGADNVFIHLDSYHMNIEEDNPRQALDDAREMLGYLHVSESHRGVPGTGNVPWAALMRAASETGYEGPMTLESFVHVDDDIASGLALWRPVTDDPDAVLGEGLAFLRDVASANGVSLRGPGRHPFR